METKMNFVLVTLLITIFASCSDYEVSDSSSEENLKNVEGNLTSRSTTATQLLWDVGLNSRSIVCLNQTDDMYYSGPSDLSEGHLDGNPAGGRPQGYITENETIYTPDLSAASVTFVSLGYPQGNYGHFPGFDLWFTGGNGYSSNYKFKNNSKQMSYLDLFEVGLVATHYPESHGIGKWSFRDEYRLTDFNTIVASFKSKLEIYREPIVEDNLNRSYLTVDFRITYVDSITYVKERTDVIGIVFCNISESDLDPDYGVYYKDFTTNTERNVILLDAEELGLDHLDNEKQFINGTYDYEERYLTFDFKPLITQYLPNPPGGFTYSDAIIVGLDIYSATKGGDVTFNVSDIQLLGKL